MSLGAVVSQANQRLQQPIVSSEPGATAVKPSIHYCQAEYPENPALQLDPGCKEQGAYLGSKIGDPVTPRMPASDPPLDGAKAPLLSKEKEGTSFFGRIFNFLTFKKDESFVPPTLAKDSSASE